MNNTCTNIWMQKFDIEERVKIKKYVWYVLC